MLQPEERVKSELLLLSLVITTVPGKVPEQVNVESSELSSSRKVVVPVKVIVPFMVKL